MQVIVRTAGDPKAVAPNVLKLVSETDRTQPVYQFQTLEQALSDSITVRRFNLFLLETFAVAAFALGSPGGYVYFHLTACAVCTFEPAKAY